MPLLLQAEGEASICRLGVFHCHFGQGFYCLDPGAYHGLDPFMLCGPAANEATKVSVAVGELDGEAKFIEGLLGSLLIFSLADVPRLLRLGEVPIAGAMMDHVVKDTCIVKGLPCGAKVISIPRLQGLGDVGLGPFTEGQEANATEVHGKGVYLCNPLLALDDNGWLARVILNEECVPVFSGNVS